MIRPVSPGTIFVAVPIARFTVAVVITIRPVRMRPMPVVIIHPAPRWWTVVRWSRMGTVIGWTRRQPSRADFVQIVEAEDEVRVSRVQDVRVLQIGRWSGGVLIEYRQGEATVADNGANKARCIRGVVDEIALVGNVAAFDQIVYDLTTTRPIIPLGAFAFDYNHQGGGYVGLRRVSGLGIVCIIDRPVRPGKITAGSQQHDGGE